MGRPSRNQGCRYEGCDRGHYGHGWCEMHYARVRSNGTPERLRRRPAAILDEDQVRVIHDLASQGIPLQEIASGFDVSKQAIWCVVTGRTWNDLVPAGLSEIPNDGDHPREWTPWSDRSLSTRRKEWEQRLVRDHQIAAQNLAARREKDLDRRPRVRPEPTVRPVRHELTTDPTPAPPWMTKPLVHVALVGGRSAGWTVTVQQVPSFELNGDVYRADVAGDPPQIVSYTHAPGGHP